MKIIIKELSEHNIKFVIYSPISFANSIRRILLGEVPGTAIDIVEIRENNSVLPDEMLANRLGLMPIYHNKNLIMKEDCDCDNYCNRCSIILALHKSNTDSQKNLTITGNDMICNDPGVICHNSLLVKLAPGQTISIKCIARNGIPNQHVKFCPVTAVAFNYDPRNAHRDTNLWFEENPKKEWPMINQTDEIKLEDCEEVEMDVEIVEGAGSPKEILLKALEIFKKKLLTVLEDLE